MKIDVEDVEKIVKSEVLKREIVEGDEADAARIRVGKFYRKGAAPRTVKKLDEPAASPPPPSTQESVTERLLREAEDHAFCGYRTRSGRSPTLQRPLLIEADQQEQTILFILCIL